MNRGAGVTLIELIVSISIVAIALFGVLIALWWTAQQSAEPILATRSAELAQFYMDEVLAKKYDHHTGNDGQHPPCDGDAGLFPGALPCTSAAGLGPESGESRATFDDVDDYHGLNESPPRTAENLPLDGTGGRPDYRNFRVRSNVAYAGSDLGLAGTLAKRIDLTVYPPYCQQLDCSFRYAAYRTNY